MKRDRFVLLWIAIAAFHSSACGQTIENQISVMAKGDIFNVSGASKVAVSSASVSTMQVFNFLDSAGAVYVTRNFPDFNRADTISTNREGDIVRLIDLSEYFTVEFQNPVN